jgi:hypothetical protein
MRASQSPFPPSCQFCSGCKALRHLVRNLKVRAGACCLPPRVPILTRLLHATDQMLGYARDFKCPPGLVCHDNASCTDKHANSPTQHTLCLVAFPLVVVESDCLSLPLNSDIATALLCCVASNTRLLCHWIASATTRPAMCCCVVTNGQF